MNGFFITGTSTGVGKTYVTALLLRAYRAAGVAAVGYKPVACGSREDAEQLRAASNGEVTLDEVNPTLFRAPTSPLAAAMIENRSLDWDAMVAGARHLANRFPLVLVEGAGGWKVPCTVKRTMADLAVELGWPVLVVVDNKLGALNHALLTTESIAHHGLARGGFLLNHPRQERDAASLRHAAILGQVTEVPVLAEIMHGQTRLDLPPALTPRERKDRAGSLPTRPRDCSQL